MIRDKLPAISTFALAGLLALLTGCGGGGDTSIASDDQSPDPAVVEIPIAYIKRPTPAPDDDGYVSFMDLNDPIAMTPGAELFVRPRSSNLAAEINLTGKIRTLIANSLGVEPALLAIDIKGLNASFDGSQLIFSVRAIPDIDNNDEPELYTWNLLSYNFETNTVAFVIDSALTRDEGAASGGGHDMYPHFLTNDSIVFSSSRQSAIQEKQLNEGRGQRYSPVAEDNPNSQAVSLHIYDPDTKEISQISLTRTADLYPTTRESGEIVFSRRGESGVYSLVQINPSGAQLSSLYGANSSPLLTLEESATGSTETIHFLQPRELPDGRIMALIAPERQLTLGGDIALINAEGFIDLFTPTNSYTGGSSRGQMSLTDLEVNALDALSPGGKFLAAYSLRDGTNRVLVSWSPCRIVNGEGLTKPCSIATNSDRINGELRPAPALFGLWMYDPRDLTQRPVVVAQTGYIISEVVAAEPRSYPDIPNENGIIDPNLAAENKGLIIIDSVYNQDDGLVSYAPLGIAAYSQPGTTTYTNRPARFIRVLQPVPVPNADVIPNIPNSGGAYGLLEILGYVPVEPDGSVTVKVPANTPIMLNSLRADGRRISVRHDTWLQVAPGEILHCVGCHDPASNVPHGRMDSQPPSQNPGAVSLPSGLEGFVGADPLLFASELGQTMAEVYDLRKPDADTSERVRDVQLQLTYSDEWTDTVSGLTPDADIDLTYDPTWDIDPAYPIIQPNLDPELQGRIVVSYVDHIQPIWARTRDITLDGNPVLAPDGNPATSCISCHTSNGNTRVPAGQLDLTDGPSEDDLFTRSYMELTRNDTEDWVLDSGAIGERTRLCNTVDADGNPVVQTITFPVPAPVRRNSALASQEFFNCFENTNPDTCGRFVQDVSPPPSNCTDSGGTVSSGGTVTTKIIPSSFTEAEVLMAAKTPPSSLVVAPELMYLLQTNCQSCHRTGGSASAYPHSDPDNDIAYNALKPYINLVNPAASIFVSRLAVRNHHCWSADCNADAAEMQTAIASFADAVPEEVITVTLPGGTPATDSSFNHYNLLTPSELRLLSEWLDTGGAFYNNPFDPRLYD